jgi:hypothetical protein
MTVTFKLELVDGTPAGPHSFRTSVYRWRPGDLIPLEPEPARRARARRGRQPAARAGRLLRWPKERLAPRGEAS